MFVPLPVDESAEPRVVLVPQVIEARPDEELIERVHTLQHVHPVGLSCLWNKEQGGVKSTPSSPRLRVGVILTDPEPVKEAL